MKVNSEAVGPVLQSWVSELADSIDGLVPTIDRLLGKRVTYADRLIGSIAGIFGASQFVFDVSDYAHWVEHREELGYTYPIYDGVCTLHDHVYEFDTPMGITRAKLYSSEHAAIRSRGLARRGLFIPGRMRASTPVTTEMSNKLRLDVVDIISLILNDLGINHVVEIVDNRDADRPYGQEYLDAYIYPYIPRSFTPDQGHQPQSLVEVSGTVMDPRDALEYRRNL